MRDSSLLAALCFALTPAACTGPESDDTAPTSRFCESTEALNTEQITDGGGSGASGKVIGRLIEIVDLPDEEGTDLHDSTLVGFVDYTVHNLDVGGSPTQGQTNQYGDFSEVLGEGYWEFEASDLRLGYLCSSRMEFSVLAGDTTELCAWLDCVND